MAVTAALGGGIAPEDAFVWGEFEGADVLRAAGVAADHEVAVGEQVDAGHVLDGQAGVLADELPDELVVRRPELDAVEEGDVDVALGVRNGGEGEAGDLLAPLLLEVRSVELNDADAGAADQRVAVGQAAHHAEGLMAVLFVERHLEDVEVAAIGRTLEDAARAVLGDEGVAVGQTLAGEDAAALGLLGLVFPHTLAVRGGLPGRAVGDQDVAVGQAPGIVHVAHAPLAERLILRRELGDVAAAGDEERVGGDTAGELGTERREGGEAEQEGEGVFHGVSFLPGRGTSPPATSQR